MALLMSGMQARARRFDNQETKISSYEEAHITYGTHPND